MINSQYSLVKIKVCQGLFFLPFSDMIAILMDNEEAAGTMHLEFNKAFILL